jgi:hypothetical protein
MNLEELMLKVQKLEDLEEIKKLHREYIACIDKMETYKVPDMFIEDGTAEIQDSGELKGKKAIEELYTRGYLSQRKSRTDGHLCGEPIITIDGDKAKGHWTVYIFFSEPSVQWTQGVNDCEYVKDNGKWKFKKLKFVRTVASDPALLARVPKSKNIEYIGTKKD